jgi:Sigma-70 region 2
MTEATLARAQAGDGEAFRELIDPHRRELQAHCYRILGSVQDAEDVLQEALLAAWRSIGRFDGQSPRGELLRDVLGFPAAEAAAILGTTQAAVNSALIRARAGLRTDRNPHDVPVPKSPAEAVIVDRFVSAFERFDLDELVALLTDEARLTMPPEPAEHRGPQPIAGFLLGTHAGQDLKFLPTRANGQPALALYIPDPNAPIWRASGLIVLTLQGNQISALTRFADSGLLARFGFPRTLPRGQA